MIRKKLVDASIGLVAFVLFSTAGHAILPRSAHAALFEYCAPTNFASCPASITGCPACTPAGLRGTCAYTNNFFSPCTRTPRSCWDPIVGCSCNTSAC